MRLDNVRGRPCWQSHSVGPCRDADWPVRGHARQNARRRRRFGGYSRTPPKRFKQPVGWRDRVRANTRRRPAQRSESKWASWRRTCKTVRATLSQPVHPGFRFHPADKPPAVGNGATGDSFCRARSAWRSVRTAPKGAATELVPGAAGLEHQAAQSLPASTGLQQYPGITNVRFSKSPGLSIKCLSAIQHKYPQPVLQSC